MTHCLHMRIDVLLSRSDTEITELLGMPAIDARHCLEEMKAVGHAYIPSEDCDGFDPVRGCPGHPDKLEETISNSSI
jgi:hypothetical protein